MVDEGIWYARMTDRACSILEWTLRDYKEQRKLLPGSRDAMRAWIRNYYKHMNSILIPIYACEK